MADKRREATPKRRAPGMNVVGPMMPSHSERRGQFMRVLLSTLTALIAVSTIEIGTALGHISAWGGGYYLTDEDIRMREIRPQLDELFLIRVKTDQRARTREKELLRRERKAEQRERQAKKQLRKYEESLDTPLYKKIDILRKAYHGCEVIYDEDLPSNPNYHRGADDVFTEAEMEENDYHYPYTDGKFDVDSTTDGDVSVSCELLTPWRHEPTDGFTFYAFTMRKENFKDGSVELSARSSKFDNGQTSLKLEVSADRRIFLEIENRIRVYNRFDSTNGIMAVEINTEGIVLNIENTHDPNFVRVGDNLLSVLDEEFIVEAMMRKLGLIE